MIAVTNVQGIPVTDGWAVIIKTQCETLLALCERWDDCDILLEEISKASEGHGCLIPIWGIISGEDLSSSRDIAIGINHIVYAYIDELHIVEVPA